MSGYAKRSLDVTFSLGTGNFGNSGFNVVTLSGLRVLANVVKAGGVSMTNAQVRVFGMNESLMNQLSTLGKPLIGAPLSVTNRNNMLTLNAYSEDQKPATVFQGTIAEALQDYQAIPEVAFVVNAYGGLIQAFAPVPPTSAPNNVDVATVMQSLASTMGLKFENNGVSVQISSPYLAGTAWQQIQSLANQANINMVVEDGVLAIWPINGTRAGTALLLSPSTGLIGYPTFADNGISLKTLFNPAIKFGSQIKVQSSITSANGVWNVYKVAHTLESEQPEGSWFTELACSYIGLPTIG